MNEFICALIIITIALYCALALKGYCKRLASGRCGGGGKSVRANRIADRDVAHYPYTAVLTIDGMVCANRAP